MGCVKKKAGRDETEEEEGMERVIEICCVTSVAACLLTASGEMSRPDGRPALLTAVVEIL